MAACGCDGGNDQQDQRDDDREVDVSDVHCHEWSRMDGASLRAEIASFLDETHRCADAQVFEGTTHDAVTVKIDEPSVIGFDAPEIAFAVDFADASMRQFGMRLDVAAPLALVILKFAARCLEGVAQRDIGIFVGMVECAGAADCDLMTRYGDAGSIRDCLDDDAGAAPR
jgi:hypothetical protein